MSKSTYKIPLLFILVLVFTAGCATTKPRHADSAPDPATQIAQLQSENQAKDQQIQELQYQLQTAQSSLQSVPATNFSGTGTTHSKYIRVSGVSVEDVQKALVRAGLDPGPVDGKMGRKTKSAIKAFQRKNNLSADGVVGEKTWSYLKA